MDSQGGIVNPYIWTFDLIRNELENKIMNTASSTGLDETKVPMNIGDVESNIDRKANSVKAVSGCTPKTATTNGTGTSSRSKFRCTVPYLNNTVIVLLVLLIFFLVEFGYVPSTKTGFFCKDPSISYDYKGDTITPLCLILVSYVLPLFLIVFVEAVRTGPHPRGVVRVAWKWYRELLIGLSATLFITEICKVIAGELRPHFLKTCRPDAAETCVAGEYVTEYECTSTGYSSYTVIDSSRSFPSGHSSIAMFASIFCVYYIQMRLKAPSMGVLFKPALITIVTLWGPVAAISRVVDHRHHWWDVLTGVILGIAGGVYTIVYLCQFNNYKRTMASEKSTASTMTLFDATNKGATSVII